MKAKKLPVVAVAAALALWGCRREEPMPEMVTGPSDSTIYATRLEAARQIVDSSERDAALTVLVLDAAAGSEPETALRAVDAILHASSRDDVAAKAALILAKSNLGKASIAMARRIGHSAVRDQTLAKIAKGDFEE